MCECRISGLIYKLVPVVCLKYEWGNNFPDQLIKSYNFLNSYFHYTTALQAWPSVTIIKMINGILIFQFHCYNKIANITHKNSLNNKLIKTLITRITNIKFDNHDTTCAMLLIESKWTKNMILYVGHYVTNSLLHQLGILASPENLGLLSLIW